MESMLETQSCRRSVVGLIGGFVARDFSSTKGKKEKELVLAPGTSG